MCEESTRSRVQEPFHRVAVPTHGRDVQRQHVPSAKLIHLRVALRRLLATRFISLPSLSHTYIHCFSIHTFLLVRVRRSSVRSQRTRHSTRHGAATILVRDKDTCSTVIHTNSHPHPHINPLSHTHTHTAYARTPSLSSSARSSAHLRGNLSAKISLNLAIACAS